MWKEGIYNEELSRLLEAIEEQEERKEIEPVNNVCSFEVRQQSMMIGCGVRMAGRSAESSLAVANCRSVLDKCASKGLKQTASS